MSTKQEAGRFKRRFLLKNNIKSKSIKMNKKTETWKKIKEQWRIFLFYGAIVLVLSTLLSAVVSTYISNKITERMAGPVCRVELPIDRFKASPEESFTIKFGMTNYKGENLFLEEILAYCFWQKHQNDTDLESSDIGSVASKLPTTEGLIQPAERPYIPAYGSKPWQSKCYSPNSPGEYNIRILVKTNKGNCESNIIMIVEKET